MDELRKVLSSAGLEAKGYAGHSFQIGAATTAAACGFGDSTIQMLGRWSSAAYLTYIKTPRNQLAICSAALGRLPS